MGNKIKTLWLRYHEIITYIFFGALTTFVNWIIYSFLVKGLQVNEIWSNIIAWVFAVSFAFVTNKIWVFESKSWQFQVAIKEGAAFVGSRLLSGVVELGLFPILLYIGLDQQLFGVSGFVAKILVSVIVIILNYIFSKFIVFRQPKEQEKREMKD